MRRVVEAALLAAVVTISGCGRAEQAEVDLQVEQRAEASRAGLTLARSRQIVGEVSGVPAEEITIMHRSLDGSAAIILASVPAAQAMLGDDPIETIDVRWDLQADLPLNVLWSERLQFAPREPVTQDEAEAVAQDLLERWVPEEAPEVEPSAAQKLRPPIYIVNWMGTVDGHLSGDQAVVQVSSVTGLPISFSQRIAQQRIPPDAVELTRDEALEAAREHLRADGFAEAETIDLVAQLNLSSGMLPDGGPAWVVVLVDSQGRQQQVLPVDAMTGEVLVGGEADPRHEAAE